MFLILTGPTASGKDTIMRKLLLEYPNLQKVLTTTSRSPRLGEKDSVDYHFISEAEFRQKIADNQFIEYVKYGDNYYGTQKQDILANLGNDTIWRIDPSRAGQIRQFIKDAFEGEQAESLLKEVLVIYISVSENEIRRRLKARSLSEQEIAKRIKQDQWDWTHYKDHYDFIVENPEGKLSETIQEISQIIAAHEKIKPNRL